MPSTVTDGMSWWRACWKPRTAASVLGPKIPSTCKPLLGSPDRLRNWNSSWTPRTASPWLPCLTVMISADQVLGPTMPSTARPFCCWKARTAASVLGPKIPSAATLWPRAWSRYCRVLTGCCWSPLRTSGHGLIVPVVIGCSSSRRTIAEETRAGAGWIRRFCPLPDDHPSDSGRRAKLPLRRCCAPELTAPGPRWVPGTTVEHGPQRSPTSSNGPEKSQVTYRPAHAAGMMQADDSNCGPTVGLAHRAADRQQPTVVGTTTTAEESWRIVGGFRLVRRLAPAAFHRSFPVSNSPT